MRMFHCRRLQAKHFKKALKIHVAVIPRHLTGTWLVKKPYKHTAMITVIKL